MAKANSKSYRIEKNSGSSDIWRGGRKVGEFPRAGFMVQVHGRGSRLAGTLLAAHALAEVLLGVQGHRRRFVLTETEYEEAEAVLRERNAELLARFPFLPEEEARARTSEERYAEVSRQGRENIKRALMNLSPYEHVSWETNPRPRPDLPPAEEATTLRM